MLITKLPFNLSPKLVFTILTAAVAWVLAHYAIDLPPELEAGIPLILASLVGYKAPAGEAIIPVVGPDSDALLGADAQAVLANPIEPTPGLLGDEPIEPIPAEEPVDPADSQK